MNGSDLGAAIFMGITWTAVICLTVFCFYKIFTQGKKP